MKGGVEHTSWIEREGLGKFYGDSFVAWKVCDANEAAEARAGCTVSECIFRGIPSLRAVRVGHLEVSFLEQTVTSLPKRKLRAGLRQTLLWTIAPDTRKAQWRKH